MFLKKLYRHSKWMFLLFGTFILAFLFINFKWGMVATPVLQYGMYSGQQNLSDTIRVYRVLVNDKLIDPVQISAGQNDFIQTFLDAYPGQEENNKLVQATLNKYFGPFKMPAELPVTDAIFSAWFRQKMQRLVLEPIQTLAATRQHFVWAGNKLAPIDTASKLTFLDAHE